MGDRKRIDASGAGWLLRRHHGVRSGSILQVFRYIHLCRATVARRNADRERACIVREYEDGGMTLNEKEARQMALKLALDYPSGGVITNPNPNAVEERAE